MRRQAMLRTTVVAMVAVLAVSGCATSGKKSRKSRGTATKGASHVGNGATGSDSTGSASTDGSSGSSGNSGGQSGTTTRAPKARPIIKYFRVAQKPSCPSGTSANPIAGRQVVLEWNATDADSITLSVDGTGVYDDDYLPTDRETLNFPCSGSEGDVQEHTYLLTATNGLGKHTKKLVVSAPVHDVPRV